MTKRWLMVGILLAGASAWGGEEGVNVAEEQKTLREQLQEGWGQPGRDVFNLGLRVWMSEANDRVWIRDGRLGTDENQELRSDNIEAMTVLFEGEMRFPHIRWLRLWGEVNASTADNDRGRFVEEEWSAVASGTETGYQGYAEVTDLDCWQLNLGLRILGDDAFWHKGRSRSSTTFFAGWRGYKQNYRFWNGHQTFTNYTVTDTALPNFDSSYNMEWNLGQVGFRIDAGFEDMLKGLSGRADIAYLFGDYEAQGYWSPTAYSFDDGANAEGLGLRLGLNYRRNCWSFSVGWEFLWLEGRHGERTNEEDVYRVESDRDGLYLGITYHF